MSVQQVSVFIENKQGRLIVVTQCLADHNVNILALTASDTADYGILRLIVDQPDVACRALREANFTVSITEVLAVAAENKPGGLNRIFATLSDLNINIDYFYTFPGRTPGEAVNMIKTDWPEKAETALLAAGVTLLNSDQLLPG